MRPLDKHAPQVRSCAVPCSPCGGSYQLPRPPQVEHIICPVVPHAEQARKPEDAADPWAAPNVLTGAPEGNTFTARPAIHATGFLPNAFARLKSHPTTVQPRNRLKR